MDTVGPNSSVACSSIVSSIYSRCSSNGCFTTAIAIDVVVIKSKPSSREKTASNIAAAAAGGGVGVGQLAQHLSNLFVYVTEEVDVTDGTIAGATILDQKVAQYTFQFVTLLYKC